MNDVVHGHCDAQFEKVADALADEIASGDRVPSLVTPGAKPRGDGSGNFRAFIS